MPWSEHNWWEISNNGNSDDSSGSTIAFSLRETFGYTGKSLDNIVGQYDYGYRHYAPLAGRFTTLDPIQDGDNWYAYCGNDGINLRDPFGLDCHANDSDATNSQDDFSNWTGVTIGEAPPTNYPVTQVPFDSNDFHCDINSWNTAIEQGRDPTPPNGGIFDGNTQTADDMSNLYEDKIDTPAQGTAGVGFYDKENDGIVDHVYNYDNTDETDINYEVWDSEGKTPQVHKEWSEDGKAVDHTQYVPLPEL